jgi:2-succinyl-6-hydroxy-2,4-cyclohexadiene-1-carboxylate synthase
MIAFIDKQKLPMPRIALGYSMGARAVLLHATSQPDYWDALILISVTAGLESEVERAKRAVQDEVLAKRLLDEGVPAFLRYWQQMPIIQSQQNIRPDWLEQMRSNRRQYTAKGLAASLRQFGQADYPNLWAKLNKLHCPILLITGEQDSHYGTFAKRMKDVLPQAQWVSIPGVGHMPHLEAPEQTAAVIERFRNAVFKNDINGTS